MKATAIYIPELGKVFFIEEILSISNIEETFDYDCFIIEFKFDKKIQINTTDYRTRKDLESIRNQFLQYCNIINAQETDKEQPKIRYCMARECNNRLSKHQGDFCCKNCLKSAELHGSMD